MKPLALVVHGGYAPHSPAASVELFVPFLERSGYVVDIRDSLTAYADPDTMAAVRLVVQCWTDGELSDAEFAGLEGAVRRGAGLAGWHGGIVDAFRGRLDYQMMVGGQFLAHPGDLVDYEVEVVPTRRDHPIVAGLTGFAVHTEKYWVVTDDASDVLVTTTFAPTNDSPWRTATRMPVVWTRSWGRGCVFVCTIGHQLPDLGHPPVRRLIEQGMTWAGGETP